MAEFPTESCMNCKFFALQPTGYSCAGFIYTKIDGKICRDNRKKRKPKECPLKEDK